MTDKPIIIDGVDVSGCEYCVKMTKYRCIIQRDVYKYLCKENPNCHYKQLKRKEQECERLKEEVSLLKESNSKLQQIEDINSLEKCYLQQIDQLKVENKQLKAEKVKYYQQTLDDEIQINELLQTLTEIKEIADENIRIADLEGLNGVYRRGLAKQILQKISECEVEDEM